MNAYGVVEQFEERIAKFAGSPYAVAVESCTAALFLSLMRCNVFGQKVICPARTYVSVPMQIIHAGGKVVFDDFEWHGVYQLKPYPVWDGAKRFREGMYAGGFHCLSFHARKHLSIGRGGAILCENEDDVKWFKRARYDGRDAKPYAQERVSQLGWNLYMTPEQAARGLMLMDVTRPDFPDQEEVYSDLREHPVFQCTSN